MYIHHDAGLLKHTQRLRERFVLFVVGARAPLATTFTLSGSPARSFASHTLTLIAKMIKYFDVPVDVPYSRYLSIFV